MSFRTRKTSELMIRVKKFLRRLRKHNKALAPFRKLLKYTFSYGILILKKSIKRSRQRQEIKKEYNYSPWLSFVVLKTGVRSRLSKSRIDKDSESLQRNKDASSEVSSER